MTQTRSFALRSAANRQAVELAAYLAAEAEGFTQPATAYWLAAEATLAALAKAALAQALSRKPASVAAPVRVDAEAALKGKRSAAAKKGAETRKANALAKAALAARVEALTAQLHADKPRRSLTEARGEAQRRVALQAA